MKRINYLPAILVTAIIAMASSCGSKKSPGAIYMPDMTYSRAYESYAQLDSSKFTMDRNNKGGKWIYFNGAPAAGTIKRGEMYAYATISDTLSSYAKSGAVKNPLDSLSKADMAEAGRLFNINCAICHGPKGDATGPLAASGKIGGVANLTLPAFVSMSEGTMFHVMTYGKGLMGSYASQLDRKQRWMIAKYIRTLQPKAKPATAAADTSAIAKK
jgi:mono/diheme cytochrome c family protein